MPAIADMPPKPPAICRPFEESFGDEGQRMTRAAEDAISQWNERAECHLKNSGHDELMAFLDAISSQEEPPPISPETAEMARVAWEKVRDASGMLMSIPATCAGPEGKVFFSWDQGKHHLELELLAGEPAEFFYRNRETEEIWGDDYEVGPELPREAVKYLKHFI